MSYSRLFFAVTPLTTTGQGWFRNAIPIAASFKGRLLAQSVGHQSQ